MSKRYEKTKQLLQKRDKDLAERNERVKELEKQVAGFTKVQEAFDVQRRQAAEREKEL